MQSYPSFLLENAVNQLAKLPGVGKKTALRLALYLLKQDTKDVSDFAQAMLMLKNGVKYCRVCKNIADTDVCQICSDPSRQTDVVCVVETIKEVMLIENTGQYKGLYHVLGAILAITGEGRLEGGDYLRGGTISYIGSSMANVYKRPQSLYCCRRCRVLQLGATICNV